MRPPVIFKKAASSLIVNLQFILIAARNSARLAGKAREALRVGCAECVPLSADPAAGGCFGAARAENARAGGGGRCAPHAKNGRKFLLTFENARSIIKSNGSERIFATHVPNKVSLRRESRGPRDPAHRHEQLLRVGRNAVRPRSAGYPDGGRRRQGAPARHRAREKYAG